VSRTGPTNSGENVSHMSALRTLFAAATVTASLFAAAGIAQAAPPLPKTNDTILPAGEFCEDFDVHLVTYSASSERPRAGSGFFAGPGFATVTNTTTNETLTYNISGPGTVLSDESSVTVDARGTNLFWTTEANSAEGVPQISYTSGPVHFTVNATTGVTTDYSHTGPTTDVCAALS
jgi:hypothetical protein